MRLITVEINPTIVNETIEVLPGAGPQGGTGKDAPQWKGNYSPTELYLKDSIVGYLGSSYVSILDVPMGINPTDNYYWDLIVSKGGPGIQGEQGIQGLPGSSTINYATTEEIVEGVEASKVVSPASLYPTMSYTFRQDTPSAVWDIAHNLNRFPIVAVIDSANTQVVGDVLYIDSNNIRITFLAGFSGKAYLR